MEKMSDMLDRILTQESRKGGEAGDPVGGKLNEKAWYYLYGDIPATLIAKFPKNKQLRKSLKKGTIWSAKKIGENTKLEHPVTIFNFKFFDKKTGKVTELDTQSFLSKDVKKFLQNLLSLSRYAAVQKKEIPDSIEKQKRETMKNLKG